MDRIRIENLRALEDTGLIDLKPITLLVGANSSGKSTFLRTFPLLKQGHGVNKQGPILWYGTEVDFGSYEDALRRGAESMCLSFGWKKFATDVRRIEEPPIFVNGIRVDCHIEICSLGYDSYVRHVQLEIGDTVHVDIDFSVNGKPEVYIDGEDISGLVVCKYRQSYGQILPIVTIRPMLGITEDDEEYWMYPLFLEEFLFPALSTVDILSGIIKDPNEELNVVNPFGTSENILKDIEETSRITLHEKERKKILKSTSWNVFRKSLVAFHIGNLLSDLDKALQAELNGCVYIKPFRAYAERYYRKQNLAVKDLDSDGHNMAMLIENMSRQRQRGSLKDFNVWTDKNFKFTVRVERSRGHVSLLIKEHDAVDYCNITDKGFGYSQVLPIILSLWQILTGMWKKGLSRGIRTKIVAFEQPELHLHPKLQAMVMDAIIAVVREASEMNYDLKFLIETHSPVMVNRLGLRIAEDNKLREKATVLLFDEGNAANPAVASFDNGGYLLNWPFGFFEPDVE